VTRTKCGRSWNGSDAGTAVSSESVTGSAAAVVVESTSEPVHALVGTRSTTQRTCTDVIATPPPSLLLLRLLLLLLSTPQRHHHDKRKNYRGRIFLNV